MKTSSLSRQRLILVRMMQQLRFGAIEGLLVERGEPVFRPPPRVVRDVLLGRKDTARQSRRGRDFAIKRSVGDLFELFDREQSLKVKGLEVQHGLPFRIQLEDQPTQRLMDTTE